MIAPTVGVNSIAEPLDMVVRDQGNRFVNLEYKLRSHGWGFRRTLRNAELVSSVQKQHFFVSRESGQGSAVVLSQVVHTSVLRERIRLCRRPLPRSAHSFDQMRTSLLASNYIKNAATSHSHMPRHVQA